MKVRQKVLLLEVILVWFAFGAVPVVRGDNVFLDDFAEDSEKGRFVIEAEHYSSRSSSTDAGWWEVDGGDHKFIEGPDSGQEAPTAQKLRAGGSDETLLPTPDLGRIYLDQIDISSSELMSSTSKAVRRRRIGVDQSFVKVPEDKRKARGNNIWWEVDGSDHKFIEVSKDGQKAPTAVKAGARGNYMVIMGILSYSVAPTDSSYDGAFIDYRVAIEKPGTYRLYVRWLGLDQGSDSLFAFILKPDGTVSKGAGPDYFVFHQFHGGWYWASRGVGGKPYSGTAGSPDSAVWRIKEPGVYTIRVAQRENKTALDTLVFQTEGLPSPANSELAESRFVDKKVENKEILAVRAQLHAALEERRAGLRTIDAALTRETLLYEALDGLLASGKYGNLSRWNVIEAQQKVRRMIETETQSREALVKAIEELKGALQTLGWTPPPPPEPVAYWSFDEGQGTTVNDSAGKNNGTVRGAEWTAGHFNNALSFDGVDDYVEVPDDPSLRFMQSSSFTISFWAMPALETEGGQIVCKLRSGRRRSVFGYQTAWTSITSEFYFGLDSSWKGTVGTVTGKSSAPAGNWYHVAAVYDDEDVRIYLNGELRDRRTFDLETGSTTPDKNLVIGARSYDSTIKSFFGGKIDEVRIYDGALSDAEIWSLYENGSLQ